MEARHGYRFGRARYRFRFEAPKRDTPRKQLIRAVGGAAAGLLLGFLLVLFGLDPATEADQRERVIVEVLGGGIAAGAILAAVGGSPAIPRKIISTLVGGASGMLVAALLAVILSLLFYPSRGVMLELSLGIVVGGGVVGMIAGRLRHKDHFTLIELMSGIALICAVLAIFLRIP